MIKIRLISIAQPLNAVLHHKPSQYQLRGTTGDFVEFIIF